MCRHVQCWYSETSYEECNSAWNRNVSSIILSVFMLTGIMLSIFTMTVIMLSLIALSVIMLSVIITVCYYDDHHYAECHYVEMSLF